MQHKNHKMKRGLCRSREDAIEDTKAMHATAAAVQQGIRECMSTATANGCELPEILHLKSAKRVR